MTDRFSADPSTPSDASRNARPPAILLMGPTAAGKTGLAAHLAKVLPVEIVSVDSAQVYRHLDIGTAKPDRKTLAIAPHHLIDILDPNERYSAARFCEDANEVLADIRSRGNIPLLAGGTMLYFKAWSEGLSALPRADAATRAVIDAEATARGWPAMHAELARVGAEARRRIRLGRRDQVDEVVRHACARRLVRLRRADVHPAIDLRGVDGDDLAAERVGERERERALARRGRAHQQDHGSETFG